MALKGSGTADSPYQINTYFDFFSEEVENADRFTYFELMKNIVATSFDWDTVDLNMATLKMNGKMIINPKLAKNAVLFKHATLMADDPQYDDDGEMIKPRQYGYILNALIADGRRFLEACRLVNMFANCSGNFVNSVIYWCSFKCCNVVLNGTFQYTIIYLIDPWHYDGSVVDKAPAKEQWAYWAEDSKFTINGDIRVSDAANGDGGNSFKIIHIAYNRVGTSWDTTSSYYRAYNCLFTGTVNAPIHKASSWSTGIIGTKIIAGNLMKQCLCCIFDDTRTSAGEQNYDPQFQGYYNHNKATLKTGDALLLRQKSQDPSPIPGAPKLNNGSNSDWTKGTFVSHTDIYSPTALKAAGLNVVEIVADETA